MSRIGKRVLEFASDITVDVNKGTETTKVVVKGPKGEISKEFKNLVDINVENNTVTVNRSSEDKFIRAYHGTVNSIINGMLIGVKDGYTVDLLIKGVGYKATLQGNKLELKVGFSHPVYFEVPEGITVEVPKATEIKISGIDKEFTTQFAAKIYLTKKPEPYGGKGIMYKGQHIIRKAGKSAGGK